MSIEPKRILPHSLVHVYIIIITVVRKQGVLAAQVAYEIVYRDTASNAQDNLLVGVINYDIVRWMLQ